jgi:NAD(P)-dependent dehydrogenase (short-subunit alcohol dehydrogenase family)
MSRTVVVTGATKGIGRAVATRFAALGDDVVALARNRDGLDELGREVRGVRAIRCDVTDERAVASALGALEQVDVLVNNAGVSESAPLHRTTLEAWDRQLRVNATGAFLCTRAVIERMRARGQGAIVTVASTAGRVGGPYTGAYAASKHAAVGLMRVAAAELAGSGATANAVCPTFADTDMTRVSAARIADRTGRSERESVAALADASPLARLLAPDEVAGAVVWLASPEAAAVNGQTLILDGGGIQV